MKRNLLLLIGLLCLINVKMIGQKKAADRTIKVVNNKDFDILENDVFLFNLVKI